MKGLIDSIYAAKFKMGKAEIVEKYDILQTFSLRCNNRDTVIVLKNEKSYFEKVTITAKAINELIYKDIINYMYI